MRGLILKGVLCLLEALFYLPILIEHKFRALKHSAAREAEPYNEGE